MTSKILFVAAILGAMMTAQAAYADPPDQSAAVRGANMHYVYHRGWHRVNEDMPVGERAGAASYPRTMPAHWEIPQPTSAPFKGDAMATGYKQMHEHGESGFLVASKHAYTGQYLLPAGTWTGEPLLPPEHYQRSTWQKNVNGSYRSDEVSGQAMVIQHTTTVTTTHTVVAPPPKNPQVVE